MTATPPSESALSGRQTTPTSSGSEAQPIRARSWPILIVFVCVLGLQLAVAVMSIDLMSAVRAYMTGESLYSKGQKEAQLHLLDYSRSMSEGDYQRFLEALSTPRGDRIAREALLQDPPDLELVRRGLVQAHNHPKDIPGAIRLFLWFQHTPLMADAIATWTEGDRLVEEMATLASLARQRILTGDFGALDVHRLQTEAQSLDARLTELETRFATQIGDGSRLGQRILLGVNLAFAILLGIAGSAFVVRSARVQAAAEERSFRAQRAHIAAMREVNELRAAFLAKVSHELRSPLQGIVSALDVLELRHANERGDEDELIRRVRRSSLLLNTHLNDLVTLAKGQAGRLELRPSPFEACALVESVASAAQELAVAKGLRLDIDVPSAPLFVIADSARIDQVLTNLLVNSIRYTERGSVRIKLAEFLSNPSTLEFSVSDTGPGIDPDVLPSLLSPDTSRSRHIRQGEGSGIGLAIVGTIVRLLDGTIQVRSSPEEGTTFILHIPVQPVQDSSATELETRSDSYSP